MNYTKVRVDYMFRILYVGGLRLGELLALTPKDIDFNSNVINIKHSYQRINKKDVITSPKTKSGIRKVEMPKELQKYIRLFDVMASTDKTQLCMCSYLDKMVLTFTTHLVDTEIEKNFFKELNSEDTEIVINDNVVEDNYEEVL